ncbi:MAG: hypothetical protein K8W52_07425, partial [Deltaproteobacteria bacterium]|nr:hypothetical protein [Deltaproteobacteria bacterium]
MPDAPPAEHDLHDDLLRRLADGADPDAIARFRAAARALPPALVARLAAAERFRDGLALRHVGPEGQALASDPAALAERDVLLDELGALPDDRLGPALAEDTAVAVAALEALRDPASPMAIRIARALPLLPALAEPRPAPVEHDPAPAGAIARPLLDHVATRALGQRLRELERGDGARFARDGVSPARLADLRARVRRLRDAGVLPCVRVAMLHLDVCKGGDAATRAAWRARGLDLAIHNLAAAALVEADLGPRYGLEAARAALAVALIASHGLAGQHLRGETPRALFAPWVAYLRGPVAALATALGIEVTAARGLAHDALHVIDVCDTAAVRDGLVDDALAGALAGLADDLVERAARSPSNERAALERELADPPPPDAAAARAILADRLARLRQGRLRGGEARAELDGAVA